MSYLRKAKDKHAEIITGKIKNMLDWQYELFEERAAIKEFCANITREEAEKQTLSEILSKRCIK